jgi:hypothetical protein
MKIITIHSSNILYWAFLLIIMPLSAHSGEILTGRVSKIQGNAYMVFNPESASKSFKAFLYGITPPEPGSPILPQFQAYLNSNVLQKLVRLEVVYTDSQGIKHCKIHANGAHINAELLKKGLARWNQRIASNEFIYKALENRARTDNAGIWASNGANPE